MTSCHMEAPQSPRGSPRGAGAKGTAEQARKPKKQACRLISDRSVEAYKPVSVQGKPERKLAGL